MAFSLQEIKGSLRKGVAFTSHYEVDVGSSDINLKAIAVSAPGRSVAATPSGVYGAIQEVGYSSIFAPISITVMSSPDHSERKFFSEWQDRIVGSHRVTGGFASESAFNVGYYNDYVRTVMIYQYDDRGTKTNTINLQQAYPRTVGELSYNYSTKEILTFTVTMQYRYFSEI